MNRTQILDNLKDDFLSWADGDERTTPQKVILSSMTAEELKKRGDISKEIVCFRTRSGGDASIEVEDFKPTELNQPAEAFAFIEKAGNLSTNDARYERLLEIGDMVADWLRQVDANATDSQLLTLSITGFGTIDDETGYYAQPTLFDALIKI